MVTGLLLRPNPEVKIGPSLIYFFTYFIVIYCSNYIKLVIQLLLFIYFNFIVLVIFMQENSLPLGIVPLGKTNTIAEYLFGSKSSSRAQ